MLEGLAGIASLITSIGNLGIGIANVSSQNRWNKINLDFQKENLKYQKQVQKQTWLREDTATQRRAADLKAAGLNPILAAGQAASSGPVVSTQAPQGEAPQMGKIDKIEAAQVMQRMITERKTQDLIGKQAANQASQAAAAKQKALLDMGLQDKAKAETFATRIKNLYDLREREFSMRTGIPLGEKGFWGKVRTNVSAMTANRINQPYVDAYEYLRSQITGQ